MRDCLLAVAIAGPGAAANASTWLSVEETKLAAGTGGEAWDFFAISGDIAIVGSRLDNDNGVDSGSTYLFDVSAPATPTQIAKLTANDGATGDQFGWSVAISGTTAIVGSPFDDNGNGSAHIYEPAVIPLPAGVWLLGSSLGLLALARRRRAA